ncbi:hypothetical protein LNP74_17585 [Klebsiella pneumoniae subsp. pneumoniae]|nr:hypothetical protein [Klebsiella pneumoniae subsp. pneumoniae]
MPEWLCPAMLKSAVAPCRPRAAESPFDLLLIDAQIVDMATGEIRPADVGIVGG